MNPDENRPTEQVIQPAYARLLLKSYRSLIRRDLLAPAASSEAAAEALFNAPFVVLSHEASHDPVFVYANRAALARFAMSLDEIIGLPSRYSAEPVARDERQQLLDRVTAQGYIDDYRGVRIDKNGQRFEVRNATVWNVIDDNGKVIGQAAAFDEWSEIQR
jgi:PAS domain-containing protein